jgi:hypothetical protein
LTIRTLASAVNGGGGNAPSTVPTTSKVNPVAGSFLNASMTCASSKTSAYGLLAPRPRRQARRSDRERRRSSFAEAAHGRSAPPLVRRWLRSDRRSPCGAPCLDVDLREWTSVGARAMGNSISSGSALPKRSATGVAANHAVVGRSKSSALRRCREQDHRSAAGRRAPARQTIDKTFRKARRIDPCRTRVLRPPFSRRPRSPPARAGCASAPSPVALA